MLILWIALYRLAELTSGSIVLDGVDVSTIGLNNLRKVLAIIPQDPVSIPYWSIFLIPLILCLFFMTAFM